MRVSLNNIVSEIEKKQSGPENIRKLGDRQRKVQGVLQTYINAPWAKMRKFKVIRRIRFYQVLWSKTIKLKCFKALK